MVSNIIEVPGITVDLDSTTSSVALGDAVTGDKATIDINGVSGKGELHVKDDDALIKLTAIEAKDFATETTLASVDAELVTLNAKDFATETTLNSLLTKVPKSLISGVEFDQIVTTYVGATTDIATVVYKNAGATVATLTLTYDGSNRLVDVLRT